MGKYSHLKGKLTQFIDDGADWVKRVDEMRPYISFIYFR